jgi:hypothetical protein
MANLGNYTTTASRVLGLAELVSGQFSSSMRSSSGLIMQEMDCSVSRRSLISVAKRVHKFSLRGNGVSVIASRTELCRMIDPLRQRFEVVAETCLNQLFEAGPLDPSVHVVQNFAMLLLRLSS